MKQNNNIIPYKYISVDELYNNYAIGDKLYFDINSPYDFLLSLSNHYPDNLNIVLINPEQQKDLFSKDFNRNGTRAYDLDNLGNIRVQKYLNKYDKSSTDFTNLKSYVKQNEKYSKYIKDLIINILAITDIPFEKLSEIIKLFTGVDISKERICEIYYENIRWKIYEDTNQIQNDIKKGIIELSGVIHYDEQYLWVKHQPYVRLTIIDAGSRVILQDIVIPREEFNKYFIKKFLTESIGGLEIDTIITDGYRAYPKIIEELGLKHQVCVFHKMKNLMDELTPIHNSLRSKIKTLKKEIPKLEKELKELEAEYKGVRGKPKEEDKKRKQNIKDRKDLEEKISLKKAELKKCTKELGFDEEIISKISRMFKYKTIKACKNKFNKLYKNRMQYRKEISDFLKRLSKDLDKTLTHVLDKGIPATNNTIEAFFKITLPRTSKRKFMTFEGMMNRILLNDIRYMKRNIRRIS